MSERKTESRAARFRQITRVGGAVQDLGRAIGPVDPQVVGIFLRPVESALLAVDPQAQAVPLAGCNLRCMQHPWRTVLHPEQHVAVVVQATALDDARQRRADLGDLQPGDEFGEVERMHADVNDASTETRLRRIAPPCGLLLTSPLEGLAQPPLRVFDDELADGTEIAALADRSRLTH